MPTTPPTTPTVGSLAPPLVLPDANGIRRSLADLRGTPVVVFFYPEDDTELCTAEACAFRDLLPRFQDLRAVVLGVSPDNGPSHAHFAAKFGLPYTLLADVPDARGTPRVMEAWGVWREKKLYGNTFMGVGRDTFLIDADGRIAAVWTNIRVKGHADRVLAALDALTTPKPTRRASGPKQAPGMTRAAATRTASRPAPEARTETLRAKTPRTKVAPTKTPSKKAPSTKAPSKKAPSKKAAPVVDTARTPGTGKSKAPARTASRTAPKRSRRA